MPKTTISYWNPLSEEGKQHWEPVDGLEGAAEAITLAIDPETGDYSRLTRFLPGADTTASGPQVHDYPEEVLILEDGSTTQHSTAGSASATTRAARRARRMGRFAPTRDALSSRSRFRASAGSQTCRPVGGDRRLSPFAERLG